MSFKDLGSKNIPAHVDTPEEAELRARAAARHKAKAEKKAARWEEQRASAREPGPPGGARGEPTE